MKKFNDFRSITHHFSFILQAVDFDISKYTNVTKWLSKLKTQLPAEPEGLGADAFRQFYLSHTKKN